MHEYLAVDQRPAKGAHVNTGLGRLSHLSWLKVVSLSDLPGSDCDRLDLVRPDRPGSGLVWSDLTVLGLVWSGQT